MITILALVATIFGDENAPPNIFINRHGGTLLAGEAFVAVTLGFMAMAADQRDIRERAANETSPSEDAGSDESELAAVKPTPEEPEPSA